MSTPGHVGEDGQRAAPPFDHPSGRGRRHGTSTSEPYDRWFRYPAGFASDYVAILLGHLTVKPESIIVDPFCGSGVTGTAARSSGYGFYGIEAHPLVAELAQIKLTPPPGRTGDLIAACDKLVAIAEQADLSGSNLMVRQGPALVERCFDEKTLLRLSILRDNIKKGVAAPWTVYAKWSLLGTLRDVATSRIGWPYQRPGSPRIPRFKCALTRFRQRALMMAEDMSISQTPSVDHRVICGDSAQRSTWSGLLTRKGDACVSSPPYLNNFDYADATRLELYFWGEVTSWSQMCLEVRQNMLTATTQQSSIGRAKQAELALRGLGSLGDEINDIAERLKIERLDRSRGKEYDRVVPDYFASMKACLENLHFGLRPGSPVVLLIGDSAPYGVYIDTPRLIAELAEAAGFSRLGDVNLRKRGLRWTNNGSRHSVELSERLITLQAE